MNKYYIDIKEANERVLNHPEIGIGNSRRWMYVGELGHKFMALATGKAEDEVKDWFPGDFLQVNRELQTYFKIFIFEQAYKMGAADFRLRSERAKKSFAKRKQQKLIKKAV